MPLPRTAKSSIGLPDPHLLQPSLPLQFLPLQLLPPPPPLQDHAHPCSLRLPLRLAEVALQGCARLHFEDRQNVRQRYG